MKVYKTIVLGASGSGKTVFLASMFNKLSVQHKEIGFYLSTYSEQQLFLMDKFKEVEETSKDWPSGTKRADFSEYVFDCKVSTSSGEHSVFRFSYLDYAGGMLTDVAEEGSGFGINTIKAEVDRSQGILVLIDGHKLWHDLQQKDKTKESAFSVRRDLRYILPNLMQCLQVPIHFVITKWDLVSSKYSLADAKQKLMEVAEFKAIVNLRKNAGKPTRLIPVSSVGEGFAKLTAKGIVEKIPGSVPKPFMVEMPLACILFDLYKVAKQDRQIVLASTGYRFKMALMRILRALGLVSAVSLKLLQWPNVAFIGSEVAVMVNDLLNKQVSRGLEYVKKKHEEYNQSLVSNDEAQEQAIRSYWLLTHKLVENFPESELV